MPNEWFAMTQQAHDELLDYLADNPAGELLDTINRGGTVTIGKHTFKITEAEFPGDGLYRVTITPDCSHAD